MNLIKKLILNVILLVSATALAQTDEIDTSAESFFSKNQKFDSEGIELYESNLDMKRHKKIGVGASVGGASGAFGLNTELNLDPENALVIGLGTGPSYGSFGLSFKHSLESNYLSSFGRVGYSRWFSASNNTSSVGTSDTLKQIFSEKELRTGKFDADFLVSAIGAEYNQLEGELSGVNFYGEFVLLAEVKTAKLVPSGAVGITYFY